MRLYLVACCQWHMQRGAPPVGLRIFFSISRFSPYKRHICCSSLSALAINDDRAYTLSSLPLQNFWIRHCVLFSSGVSVKIRFSVLQVSGYTQVFLPLSVVVVSLPKARAS